MTIKNIQKVFFRWFKPTLFIAILALLGFHSCRSKPKTKYGPPAVEYRTSEKEVK